MSSTTEPCGDTKGPELCRKKLINTNLISLKCLIFFFFGGMGCLLPFLPLHMLAVGLSPEEIRGISMIAPCAAMIGPLIAGPLADRVATSRFRRGSSTSSEGNDDHHKHIGGPPSNGRYLRVMIAVCCVFAALFYSLLLVVPAVTRIELAHELRPAVRFSCDENGAVLHQERCKDAFGCHRWSNEEQIGTLRLSKCEFACHPIDEDEHRRRNKFPPAQADSPSFPTQTEGPSTVIPLRTTTMIEKDALQAVNDEENSDELGVVPLKTTSASIRQSRDVKPRRHTLNKNSEAPHVCYKDAFGRTVCHVFGDKPRNSLVVNASLLQAVNSEDIDDWCAYPVAQYFSCRIPEAIQRLGNNQSCLVECLLNQPYDSDEENNILAESQCRQVIGNEQLTFWMYLGIRCLADIFPMAALALIDAAIVIATRETSTGRGDVGRQLAFGALGLAIFGPLSGYLTQQLRAWPYIPLGLHGLLALLTACVALTAESMPLGPPEWWWHTRSGMLALPMSAVRKYGGEAAGLFLLLILVGTLWSGIDSYLPIHLSHLKGDELSIGLALTVGALPAILFLWRSEHLVDYCGHSNLLITAFIFYIVRYTGLSLVPDVWWSLISEALELFTLEIMWVTAILYFRHLIPRQMTATGQALPVIAHFCIGRAIGAVIGACVDKIDRDDEVEAMRFIYKCMAIAAAVIATLYFVLYHGVLKPRCHAQTVQNGHRQPPTIVQAMNGNGNYTPLRVYHNGMGRKGQFRY